MAWSVRAERPGDAEAVDELLRRTFPGGDEAALVERLRADGDVSHALVATEGGKVVGHIVFSRLELRPNRCRLLALAPLAVAPERQRRGIGSDLAARGLEESRARGAAGVIVLGDPAYYARFGFRPERARALAGAYAGTDAFMALEFDEDALSSPAEVTYPRAFSLL